MATYVLVAGNWLGGWAWEQVAERLTAAGHAVHPVTLTGLGDRVHLAGAQVTLDTHVDDIVNTIEYANLHDVVLVGHSYGGLPVTGAAERIPERIAKLVYVESGPLPSGVSQLDTEGPEARDAALARMKDDPENGWRGPLPRWEDFDEAIIRGLGEQERATFASRAVDQPLAANAQRPVHTNETARNTIPHALVTCMFPLEQVDQMIADGHPFFAGFGGKQWEFAHVPTGHWPMFSEPAKLAETLDGLA
ncbi:alpha/beta fold hydrolase [Flindersiella endophytica]